MALQASVFEAFAKEILGPVHTNVLRWLNRNMAGFKARGAPCTIGTQATSNAEDRHIPIQPAGKRHILSISASLLLAVLTAQHRRRSLN